ncbi:hypothetical protein [Vibrio spartinae]|uniref:hypothetical protein n=1 Tax=Vibrio spartinae TaxID=1918945 RepID=UPI001966E627|nr:hypothetical protein [Vibrio spartinae]
MCPRYATYKCHRRCFRRLQRAYIEARYSEHYEITVGELAYLEVEVQKLKGLVERICLGRVDPQTNQN